MLCYWFDERRPERAHVVANIERRPGAYLLVSVVSLGEIEFGERVNPTQHQAVHERFLGFVHEKVPHRLDLHHSTATRYGELRARLFDRYAPKGKRRAGLRPEQLVDPISSLELGIQENDLWIAAQAIDGNFVLVTHDRMKNVRAVCGADLSVEDWAAPRVDWSIGRR